MPDLKSVLPSSLRSRARWTRLADVPVMLVHPGLGPDESADGASGEPVPVCLWMHGRTAHKELDPGRYLRWMRAGIGACAIDLPGHGERGEPELQQPERSLDVVLQMSREIDRVLQSLRDHHPEFDLDRLAIGGMSAGGMATLHRLTTPHPFRVAVVEATSGSWARRDRRNLFQGRTLEELVAADPRAHLSQWREIPLQAIHSRGDQWVDFEAQHEFIEALRSHYRDPSLIELVDYEETGAPYEHIGFGRRAADAKDRQRDFLVRHLMPEPA